MPPDPVMKCGHVKAWDGYATQPSICLDCANAYASQQVAAYRAVVRELAQLLENACTMRQTGGFVGDNIDRWLTSVNMLLAHPLVQQAREEKA